MFERFSQQTRQVIIAAQDEARNFRHDYVGTGHLLIGLLKDDGVAGRVLADYGVEVEAAKSQLATISGYGEEDTSSKPFTSPSKKMMESARDKAGGSGRYQIEPKDLLVALAHQPEGVADEILTNLAIDRKVLRERLRDRP